MNRTDYILTITKGILEAPQEHTQKLLDYFGAIFELNEIQKSGAVSLAAGLDGGNEASFSDWVKMLQAEGIKKCLVRSVAQTSEQLPAHIAAAFAGTQEYLIEVITEQTARCYVLKSFYPPSYAITTQQFIELTDAQTNSNMQWEFVAEQITASNQLNGRKAVNKSAVREYLNSREGKEVFNFLVSNLSGEMQIECTVSETPFIIPEYLKHLFYQQDFSFGGDDREIAFLYSLKEVSPEELLMLVDAQSFAADIWPACEKELQEYPSTEIPVLKAAEFEGFIKKQTTETLTESRLPNSVCMTIRTLCEHHHVRPVIPQELTTVFGPDKKEYDKALARGTLKGKWYLQSNENRWEVCYFEPLPITTLLESKGNIDVAKKEFAHALAEIADLAKRLQSPFEEAFRLASYFLTEAVPIGNYDQHHQEIISKDLQAKGFSERALEVLKNNFLYLEEWHKMKFDEETILGLFAVNNANHFGGMGSWNDQYVEQDPENYERVSAQTFSAMKNYFVTVLSK